MKRIATFLSLFALVVVATLTAVSPAVADPDPACDHCDRGCDDPSCGDACSGDCEGEHPQQLASGQGGDDDEADANADEDGDAGLAFEAGPHGTVKLANKLCPVMGHEADPEVGTAINGWWVNFCCPGCDRKLKADLDKYAPGLLEKTGIDIRKHVAAYVVRPNRHFADGPEGTDTKRLGNALCPVMGHEADPEVGAAINGWWINFCCPGCDDKLTADLDKYAPGVLEKTGVDIRHKPEHYTSLPNPPFEAGPDGSIKLGNTHCPVMGGEVDPEVGVVINGWWINFCCPGCDRKLKRKLDEFAPAIREATGIDIRRSPRHYLPHPRAAAHGAGATDGATECQCGDDCQCEDCDGNCHGGESDQPGHGHGGHGHGGQ